MKASLKILVDKAYCTPSHTLWLLAKQTAAPYFRRNGFKLRVGVTVCED